MEEVMEEVIDQVTEEKVKGEREELSGTYHPWLRYFARGIDYNIYKLIFDIFLVLGHVENNGEFTGVVNVIVSMALMMFLEPLMLHIWGTTPGKAILGLRITKSNGELLSYGEGLIRTAGAICMGMGLNIPLVNLIFLWLSYKKCKNGVPQPWDEGMDYAIKDRKRYRYFIYVGCYVLVLVLAEVTVLLRELPPYRGELTVTEYAENYNFYLSRYSNGNSYDEEIPYLKADGTWNLERLEEERDSYPIYLFQSEEKQPEIVFETEDGNITKITIYDCYNERPRIYFASLAYGLAQNECVNAYKHTMEIAENVDKIDFVSDYEFSYAGITFTYECSADGRAVYTMQK